MTKVILQILGLLSGLALLFGGIIIIASGASEILTIIKNYNEKLYLGILMTVFGLCFFMLGKKLITTIVKQK